MEKRIKKWKNYKFGMFIHYGLFSNVHDGLSGWGLMYNNESVEDYINKTLPLFDSSECNTDEWVEIAKKAGMKYAVLTTRHHDGFSLWDSKGSWKNHTSMNSPSKRDIVKEFSDSCEKFGIGKGFYYSPIDWRFPGFYNPVVLRESAEEMVTQCHEQLKELTTNYGDVDVLWFDGGEDGCVAFGIDFGSRKVPDKYLANPRVPGFWREDDILPILKKNQPNMITSERFGSMKQGDFKVYEMKNTPYDTENAWEACNSITPTWSWNTQNQPKSVREIINLLIKVITGGGNLLLNLPPDGKGKFDPLNVKRLLEVGEFVNKYAESIFDTEAGPIVNGIYGGTTHNDYSVYLHMLDWRCDEAPFPTNGAKIKNVECLTADTLSYRIENDVLYLNVNSKDKCYYDTIFKITFEDKIENIYKDFDPRSFKIDEADTKFYTDIYKGKND